MWFCSLFNSLKFPFERPEKKGPVPLNQRRHLIWFCPVFNSRKSPFAVTPARSAGLRIRRQRSILAIERVQP